MGELKLCFSTLGCPGMGVEEVVALAAANGMYGVEMRGKGPQDMLSPETPAARRGEIRRLFAENGLAMAGITGYVRFCETAPAQVAGNLETLERYAALCAEMGAGYLRAYLGEPADGAPIETLYPAIGESLAAAARRLEGYPVQLLLEMHDTLGTARQAQEILTHVGAAAPNLGFIWDAGAPVFHGEAPAETWRLLGQRIGAVHLRDAAPLPDGKRKQVLPGEGVLPLGEMLRVLAQSDFTGPAVVKWERVFDRSLLPIEQALPVFARYIRKGWEG